MKAVFMHWVKGVPEAGLDNVPFYNLLEGNDRHPAGSTVSDVTLHRMGLPIPLTPTYSTYKQLVAEGKRCRTCWSDSNCPHQRRSS